MREILNYIVYEYIGLSADQYNDDSSVWYAYHHGLVSDQLWSSILQNCCQSPYTRKTCNFYNSTDSTCKADVNKVMDVIYGGQLNWYNIYGDCLQTTQARDRYPLLKLRTQLSHQHKEFHKRTHNKYLDNLKENVPCLDTTGGDIYLNRTDVKEAIHVTESPYEWSICVNAANWVYNSTYPDLTPVYNDIFTLDSNIYGLLYNGDTDLSCNFLGDQWFVEDLGFKQVKPYREWFYQDKTGKQVAGWTTNYERISFVTVRGSGHMVPQYRPKPAKIMFEHFLANKDL